MNVPRDLSSKDVIRELSRFGYAIVRQTAATFGCGRRRAANTTSPFPPMIRFASEL